MSLPWLMGGEVARVTRHNGNVLQLSMRRVHDLVAFCAMYEFEDVIAEATAADRVEPTNFAAIETARRMYKLGRFATGSRKLARALTPRLGVAPLDREYDLFFPVFNHPWEIFALSAVPDWRSRCRVAACFVTEIWTQLPEYLFELLADFDHIFLGVSHPAKDVARIVGRPCTYLPLAVDVLRFAPYPNPAARSIDVCNIGRRSSVTHAALLQLARERRVFYYYDTVRASGERGRQMTFSVGDASAHRLLLASLLQRTRYYVANRARMNEPEVSEVQQEISGRFYEGVAAGAVVIGVAPRSAEFQCQFDWPDAVIDLPFDSPDIRDRLRALDADMPRIQQVARRNVHEAALRHDWIHRLRTVYATLGLPPTEGMLQREERLRSVAALARSAG